jgi:site-specific DNA-methyltransferase (adenine-specific)
MQRTRKYTCVLQKQRSHITPLKASKGAAQKKYTEKRRVLPIKYDNGKIKSIKTSIRNDIIILQIEKNNLHPTQKPVALLEYLIKTYSNEGDLVLDNCMGSGSTGVAAVNTNRRFIGIELDEKVLRYFLQKN